MGRSHLFLALAILLVAAAADGQNPKKTADALTGNAKGPAAGNPLCKLFTVAEASKYVGKPVGAGENAAMQSACQWAAKDDDGDMMVQIVDAAHHEQPTLAKGFQRLPEFGPKAFVVPEMGGFKAATVRGNESIIVSVSGTGVTAQTAVALLKDTLNRRK